MSRRPSTGSTTLPRGFRFHSNEDNRPQTPEPEPAIAVEPHPPSPPRPTRLKVRRRNAPSYQTPTEQFLASVAAADVPIPTIEEPQEPAFSSEDFDMADANSTSVDTSRYLTPEPRDLRGVSPPKTPIPEFPMEEGYSQHVDWSMDAVVYANADQRPSSSMSNCSDYSLDSFYSGSRVSRRSDGSCTSPESDAPDPFQFPSLSKGKGKALYRNEEAPESAAVSKQLRNKTRTDAPWTKDQSTHLWATYLKYLQDPTVTPFRVGASLIPPQGVVHRVARAAKRLWKGPKVVSAAVRRSSRNTPRVDNASSDKSGSITPTAEAPKVYAQWPHSSNATRAHLREMCKNKDSNLAQHYRHFPSRSPVVFTKPVRAAPPHFITDRPSLQTFSHDIAMSLTTSTSATMQPDGPLAKLAASDEPAAPPSSAPAATTTAASSFSPIKNFRPLSFGKSRGLELSLQDETQTRGRRLGSPFSRTYGPSSSQGLDLIDPPSTPRTQFNTATRPRLRSPVRFEEPRSLTGTQKRRAQHSLEEELSPNGAVLRPSILDEQLFGTPAAGSQRRVRTRGFSLGDDVPQNGPAGPLPPLDIGTLFTTARATHGMANTSETHQSEPVTAVPSTTPHLLPAPTFESPPRRPRLGSPFGSESQTFPRRLFPDTTATIRRSAFATMHQTRRSIESFDFGEADTLQSRLSTLDQKLREIRDRDRDSTNQQQNS